MALARVAGASILAGVAAVLMRRTLRCRPDWYDEPLPDQEDDLLGRLVAGRMTRAGYQYGLDDRHVRGFHLGTGIA